MGGQKQYNKSGGFSQYLYHQVGETIAELKEDFEGAVDDYLAMCEAEGITPRKSYTGTFNIRISPETHNRIAMLASAEGVSINTFVRQTLDNRVASCL